MIKLERADILHIGHSLERANDGYNTGASEQLDIPCTALNDEKIYAEDERVKRVLVKAMAYAGRDCLGIRTLSDCKGELSVIWDDDMYFIVGNDYITRAWKEEGEHNLLHYVNDDIVATTSSI